MRRRLSTLFFIAMYLHTTMAQALVPPTAVGVEIAQVMASRGAVTGLSRVAAGLGPWGLLASFLIPVIYGWVVQPDGNVSIPGRVVPNDASLPSDLCWTAANQGNCFGSKEAVIAVFSRGEPGEEYSLGPCANNECAIMASSPGMNGLMRVSTVQMVARNGRTLTPAPTTPGQVMTLPDAISSLSAEAKAQPIPAAQVANAVNQVWYDAAVQPGYTGPAYEPVTEAQVQAVRTATGTSASVGSLADPVAFPDPATVSNPLPTTTTPATPGTTPTQPAPFPNDYSREATQQAVLQAVSGTGMPDGTALDRDVDLAKISTQNQANKGEIEGITPQSIGLPTNWFPTIPTAACVNPSVPTPISGAMVSVNICEPVSVLSTFLNGVICFLALVGSVRQVQSALKA